MNQERLLQVLRAPRVTEKTTLVGEAHNQYVFEVGKTATKPEIAAAVGTLFDVKVRRVTTLNVKPKPARFRGRSGKRAGWKKAYVTLADGEEIDFLDTAAQ